MVFRAPCAPIECAERALNESAGSTNGVDDLGRQIHPPARLLCSFWNESRLAFAPHTTRLVRGG